MRADVMQPRWKAGKFKARKLVEGLGLDRVWLPRCIFVEDTAMAHFGIDRGDKVIFLARNDGDAIPDGCVVVAIPKATGRPLVRFAHERPGAKVELVPSNDHCDRQTFRRRYSL